MEHKKQHYIPQSYLGAWTDPETPAEQEPYVWVFPFEAKSGRRKAPKNLFHETDMYTIPLPDGSRDLRLEHGLSSLETEFVHVRDKVVFNGESPCAEDRAILCLFAAALQARTPKQRDHLRGEWQKILEKGRRLQEQFEGMKPEQRAALSAAPVNPGQSLSIEDVERMVEQPAQTSLVPSIQAMAPVFAGMTFTLLRTDDEQGFITSDAPCVIFDPKAHTRPWPYNSHGLGWKTVEVHVPLSPKAMLLLSWQGLPDLLEVSGFPVRDLNRLTRFSANQEFVNHRNFVDDYWFDPRTDLQQDQPADSDD